MFRTIDQLAKEALPYNPELTAEQVLTTSQVGCTTSCAGTCEDEPGPIPESTSR